MGLLKFTDPSSVKRYTHPEDAETWVDLRTTLSRGLTNDMLSMLPDAMLERDESDVVRPAFVIREAPELSKALFASYVKAWSADVAPTLENYLLLDPEPAAWVDSVLFEHVNQGRMTKDEAKKPTTSPKATRKGTPDKES